MTIRYTFLGMAAGLASIGAASAADLPMTKAESVEYVKVCSAFGPGFFYIPGSDTCLQISGQIRADYFYQQPSKRSDNQTTFRTQSRIRFDARTDTDYGVLRSFLELEADTNSLGTSANGATGTNFLSVRRAYIQFGGLTAGYAWSPYSFFDQNYADMFFAPYFGEQGRRDLISYTAQYDKLWATLSIEDPEAHDSTSSLGASGTATGLAGSSMPDIVGVLGYDDNKNWGRVQVMGAIHQNRALNPSFDSKTGYAVGLGGNLNIPILSGAYIAAEASYADGAQKYLNSGGADAYGNALDHNLGLAKGWTIQTEAAVNLTPALQAMIFGGYLKYDAPSVATHISDNFKYYVVGGQVNYTVVKGFIAGAEVWYQNKDPEGTTPNAHLVGAGIRLRRTF